MTTRVRITNLETGSKHAIIALIGHIHPSSSPPVPTRIDPGQEKEFVVSDTTFITVKEANGLNDQVTQS